MNALPEAWAAWAARKEEEPETEWNPDGWIDDLPNDEKHLKSLICLVAYELAGEANGHWCKDGKKYRVLVPPDRLRELGTRRHKWIYASFRRTHKRTDPGVPLIVRFHAGALCREFLETSRWSWLFLEDATQERIDAGKGTPADLVFLSTKTALLSRLWDEHKPERINALRSNYYRERTYCPEDQEVLELYREDLLYLAEIVKE